MTDSFQSRIQTLLRNLGIDRPPQGAGDAYTVTVDQKLELQLAGSDDSWLTLFAEVGELPQDSETRARELLQANLFSASEPPRILALDAERGTVLLWQRLALAQCDDAMLFQLFEAFMLAAEDWQARLQEQPDAAQSRREWPPVMAIQPV